MPRRRTRLAILLVAVLASAPGAAPRGSQGEPPELALDGLRAALVCPDESVHAAALDWFRDNYGATAPTLTGELSERVRDLLRPGKSDGEARIAAIRFGALLGGRAASEIGQIAASSGGSIAERRAALEALGRIGPEAQGQSGVVAKAVGQVLKDQAPGRARSELLVAAARALGDLKGAPIPAVAALSRLLASGIEAEAREAGIEALVRLDAAGSPSLVEILRSSDDERARLGVCEAARRQGPSAGALAPELLSLVSGTGSIPLRRTAARALASVGVQSADLDELGELVGVDQDAEIRAELLRALERAGPEAAPCVPALVELIQAVIDQPSRRLAEETLAAIGDEAVSALLELLQPPRPSSAALQSALRVLAVHGDDHSGVVGPLLAPTHDGSVRAAAAAALGGMGPAAKEWVPSLMDLARADGVVSHRCTVVATLGRLRCADELRSLLDIGPDIVESRAAAAYVDLGLDVARAHLLERLGGGDTAVEHGAATTLAKLGCEDEELEDALRRWLASTAPSSTKRAALEALRAHGSSAFRARFLEQVHSLLYDDRIRFEAVRLLAEIGLDARKLTPAVLELLQPGVEHQTRRFAIKGLVSMGTAGQHIGELVPLLGADDARTSRLVAEVLQGLGTEVVPHAADLLELAEEPVIGGDEDRLEPLLDVLESLEPHLAEDPERRGDEPGAEEIPPRREIARRLGSAHRPLRDLAARVLLARKEPLQRHELVHALEPAYRDSRAWPRVRAASTILAGSTDSDAPTDVARTLSWIWRNTSDAPQAPLPPPQVIEALSDLDAAWPEASRSPPKGFVADLREAVAAVAERARCSEEVAERLEEFEVRLAGTRSGERVAKKIDECKPRSLWEWIKGLSAGVILLGSVLGGSVLFMSYELFILVAYLARPDSHRTQSWAIYTEFQSKVLGFPFFVFTLFGVGLLRRAMRPFRERLENGPREGEPDLSRFELRAKGGGDWMPAEQLLPELDGLVLVEGGHSDVRRQLILDLVANSARVAVYLRAEECTKGVLEAIQGKLSGFLANETLLKRLLIAKKIEVYVDGLDRSAKSGPRQVYEFSERLEAKRLLLAKQQFKRPPKPNPTWLELRTAPSDPRS